MSNPQYIKIKDKRYKINTSYKCAIKCEKIAQNNKIGDYERGLAIIYTLFGDDGLNSHEDWQELLKMAKRYLSLDNDKKVQQSETSKVDFDYVQDEGYIKASFMYDYGIDLDKEPNMHWWTFFRLLNGLSNSEFGNCCILNRVRNLRNFDLSKIKDVKERNEIMKAQKSVELHFEDEPENVKYTKEEKESINNFYKQMGILRKED